MTKTRKEREQAHNATVAARLAERKDSGIPHNLALGIEIVDGDKEGIARQKVRWREDLVGNPETGVLHGGAVTALIDSTCGMAVIVGLGEKKPIATLDLRIDYLRPATPRKDVIARAELLKYTRHVAFVRCLAYHEGEEDDFIAAATGTFMLGTKGRPRPTENEFGKVS
jgi:uncharacterized protein (TIGR00369 family)